ACLSYHIIPSLSRGYGKKSQIFLLRRRKAKVLSTFSPFSIDKPALFVYNKTVKSNRKAFFAFFAAGGVLPAQKNAPNPNPKRKGIRNNNGKQTISDSGEDQLPVGSEEAG
ncbi:MAG: hypothetical protein ACI3XR_00310, partial [Eubacteriales bacterium]